MCIRLRENKNLCSLVAVTIKTNDFMYYSHQRPLKNATDCTLEIFEGVKKAFIEMHRGEKIGQLGVRLTKLCSNEYYQGTFFDFERSEKQKKIDTAMDTIRRKYGKEAVIRSTFLHTGIKSLSGGTGDEEYYPVMSSIL